MLRSSWREVSLKTIRNCSQEVGIFSAEVTDLHDTRIEIHVTQEFTDDVKKNPVEGFNVTQEEFCNCNKQVLISELKNL